MASETDVCNIALIELGQSSIADISDTKSEPARLCKARYESVRDAVQRAHPWNSCISRGQWALDPTAPLFGFSGRYKLSTDPWCLRVLQAADRDTKFKVEGRWLLTDAGDPLNVLFIARVTDVAQWDPMLVQAVGLYLAHSIAFKLTTNRSLENDMRQKFVQILREARSIDGMEGSPDEYDDSYFLEART
jgi:hypothetical protein